MLCAGVENTILSGCHGDSGGPYVCLNADKKTYTLHGAVSWGSGSCNAKQLFSVFARVTKFRAWIKQHTGVGGGGLEPVSINSFAYIVKYMFYNYSVLAFQFHLYEVKVMMQACIFVI